MEFIFMIIILILLIGMFIFDVFQWRRFEKDRSQTIKTIINSDLSDESKERIIKDISSKRI